MLTGKVIVVKRFYLNVLMIGSRTKTTTIALVASYLSNRRQRVKRCATTIYIGATFV